MERPSDCEVSKKIRERLRNFSTRSTWPAKCVTFCKPQFGCLALHFAEERAASADDGAEIFSALRDAANDFADVITGLFDWDDAAEEGDVDDSLAMRQIETGGIDAAGNNFDKARTGVLADVFGTLCGRER